MATTGEPTYPPTSTPIPEEPMAPGAPPTAVPMAPPPKRITSGGIIAIIGGILMLVAIALDWMSVTTSGGGISLSLGTNAFSGPTEILIYAIVVLLMGILAIVVVIAKKPVIAGVFGIIGLIVMFVAMFRIGWESMSAMGITVSGGPGMGVYLGLVGAILAMIGGFVGHKQM